MNVNWPNQSLQPIWDAIIEKRIRSNLPGYRRPFSSMLGSACLGWADKILSTSSSSYVERKSFVSYQIVVENLSTRRPEIKQRMGAEIARINRIGTISIQASSTACTSMSGLPIDMIKEILKFNTVIEKVLLQRISTTFSQAGKESIQEMNQTESLLAEKQARMHLAFLLKHFDLFLRGTFNPWGIRGELYFDNQGNLIGLSSSETGYGSDAYYRIIDPQSLQIDDRLKGDFSAIDREHAFAFQLNLNWNPSSVQMPFCMSVLSHFQFSLNMDSLTEKIANLIIEGFNAKALEAWEKAQKSALPQGGGYPIWLDYFGA